MGKIKHLHPRKFLKVLAELEEEGSKERAMYDLEKENLETVTAILESDKAINPKIVTNKVGTAVKKLIEKSHQKWGIFFRFIRIDRSLAKIGQLKGKIKRANDMGRLFALKSDQDSSTLVRGSRDQLRTLVAEYDEILRDLRTLKKETDSMKDIPREIIALVADQVGIATEIRGYLRMFLHNLRQRKATNTSEFKSLNDGLFPHVNRLWKLYRSMKSEFKDLEKRVIKLETYEEKLAKILKDARHQLMKLEAA